jgi:hypothetical protein
LAENQSSEDYETEHATTLPGRPLWSITYLDLSILLMIFFILLVSISHYETGKLDPVLKGVRDAFHSALPLDLRNEPPERRGRAIDDSFVNGVGQLFADELPLPHALAERRADYVAFNVPIDAVFLAGAIEPRVDRDSLFRRLAILVQTRPPGVKLSIEALLGGIQNTPHLIGRAGGLARALVGQGMPPGALAVGMTDADPTILRIVFQVEPADAPRVDFRGRGG